MLPYFRSIRCFFLNHSLDFALSLGFPRPRERVLPSVRQATAASLRSSVTLSRHTARSLSTDLPMPPMQSANGTRGPRMVYFGRILRKFVEVALKK